MVRLKCKMEEVCSPSVNEQRIVVLVVQLVPVVLLVIKEKEGHRTVNDESCCDGVGGEMTVTVIVVVIKDMLVVLGKY